MSTVTRRKGGTLSRRHRSNGYVHDPHKKHSLPDNRPQKMPRFLNRGIQNNITKPSSDQCETAPLAPNPVCERTN